MPESERHYASEIVTSLTSERLKNKKQALERELATLSFKLAELDDHAEDEPTPLTINVRARSLVWRDDGYVGGDVTKTSIPLKITASYFLTAYLGALAKEPRDGQKSEISFENLEGMNQDAEYPKDEVRDAFYAASDEARAIVQKIREDITDNNPYKDIPIRINHSKLNEALLSIEVLKYCEALDPNFAIVIP